MIKILLIAASAYAWFENDGERYRIDESSAPGRVLYLWQERPKDTTIIHVKMRFRCSDRTYTMMEARTFTLSGDLIYEQEANMAPRKAKPGSMGDDVLTGWCS